MYQRAVLFSFIFIVLAVFSRTADAGITGKVSNQAGAPVEGAVVTLMSSGVTATTGADGLYTLVTTAVNELSALQPKSTSITLRKGCLSFNLSNSSPVKYEIFDVKGNLLKSEMLRNVHKGIYRFNIEENIHTTNYLIIRASIGNEEVTFNYLPIHNGKSTMKSPAQSSTPAVSALSKITAIADTVKVTADGYTEKTIPITSYELQLDITLFDEGAVVVQLDQTRQKIDGFGINNNWQPAWSDQQADDLFDPEKGLGLNILRIGMNENGEPYNGNDCWSDIKKAKARGCEYIIGTLWTAPGRMKTNGSVNDGGYLKEDSWVEWSNTIAAFPDKVKQGSGYDLYAMSPQNETDFASCGSSEPCNGSYPTMLWTGKKYAEFFKLVAPKIRAAGCKAMGPEASEWLHAWSDFSACCTEPGGIGSSDPLGCGFLGKDDEPLCNHEEGYDYGHWLAADQETWDMVDIFSTHQYDTQEAEPWPEDVPRENAQGVIPIWQTEMSGVKWWPEQGPSTDIKNGVAVAGWIHNALTVGEASGWCWWWYKALGATNEGIYNSDGSDTKRHYTFGNFSRYVRPGMVRVEVTGDFSSDVLLSAYKSESGQVVVVGINKSSGSVSVPISISGGTTPSSMTPYVTSESENWGKKSAVAVSDGSFTAELGGTTVTTFVGE